MIYYVWVEKFEDLEAFRTYEVALRTDGKYEVSLLTGPGYVRKLNPYAHRWAYERGIELALERRRQREELNQEEKKR